MFYFLVISGILMCLYQIYQLWKLEKHDRVLYEFCDTRRRVMSLIREGNFNLSKEDYVALRELAEATSITIHDYNEWKSSLFNFRIFRERMSRIRNFDKRFSESKITNPAISDLYAKFVYGMISAFLTYTPFLRSEIGFRTLSLSINGIARISMGNFKARAMRLMEFATWIRQQAKDREGPLNPRHST